MWKCGRVRLWLVGIILGTGVMERGRAIGSSRDVARIGKEYMEEMRNGNVHDHWKGRNREGALEYLGVRVEYMGST